MDSVSRLGIAVTVFDGIPSMRLYWKGTGGENQEPQGFVAVECSTTVSCIASLEGRVPES